MMAVGPPSRRFKRQSLHRLPRCDALKILPTEVSAGSGARLPLPTVTSRHDNVLGPRGRQRWVSAVSADFTAAATAGRLAGRRLRQR